MSIAHRMQYRTAAELAGSEGGSSTSHLADRVLHVFPSPEERRD
jgi:hypothetical protein